MLNKTTGCESRTVPPLYVLMRRSNDESQSLGITLGRQSAARLFPANARHESEDLRNGFSHSPRDYGGVRLSQKNGCGVIFGAAASLFFGGMFMKTTMKTLVCLLTVVLLACSVFSGCKAEPLVIKDSDTCIVIKTTAESLDGKTDLHLIDYMNQLVEAGELSCTIQNGMVTSINGIENPADFSSCWMLYTSDAENANTGWGVVEYEGVEYGSSVSGAETLVIKPDQLYIWVYQSFN